MSTLDTTSTSATADATDTTQTIDTIDTFANFAEAAQGAKLFKKLNDSLEAQRAELAQKIADLKAEFDRKVAEEQHEYHVLAGPLETAYDTMKRQFDAYHEQLISANAERKTINFRFGQTRMILQRRIQQPEIIREPKDTKTIKQLEQIKELLRYVKTEKKLDWAGLKKQASIDAEHGIVKIVDTTNNIDIVLDGFTVTAKEPTHKVVFETIPIDSSAPTANSYNVVTAVPDLDTLPVTITTGGDEDSAEEEDLLDGLY